MKIAIIGYSGSGKSTLAKRLAQLLGIEPFYLDRVNFCANWTERDKDEGREMVRREMEQPSWVIDGNYRYLLREERLRDADQIIWMNYPRVLCLMRALKRHRDHRGIARESAGDGCIERMKWEFAWWILHKGRSSAYVRGYQDIVARYPEKCVILRNDRELEQFVVAFEQQQNKREIN